ncbi:hypothetical protein CSB69_2846 [Morganella morganii]|nr:hypothetical protein CSB69_2846 [Morganella morganii]
MCIISHILRIRKNRNKTGCTDNKNPAINSYCRMILIN